MAQFSPCNRPAVIVPSIIAAGLLVSGLWAGTRPSGDETQIKAQAPQLDTAPLACLPPATVQQIKQKLDDIEPAYQSCREEIGKRAAGMHLDDKGLRVVFATITAHASAEYGSTTAYGRADLLKAENLTSIGYLLLLGHFMQALDVPSDSMRIIGFQGGKIGNYVQGMITVGKASLLLDPTVGMVAKISFDDLLGGRTVPADRMVAAYMHIDPGLKNTLSNVSGAVFNGQYRPSDLLYFFDSPGRYLSFNGVKTLKSEGGIQHMPSAPEYPTPGGARLANKAR